MSDVPSSSWLDQMGSLNQMNLSMDESFGWNGSSGAFLSLTQEREQEEAIRANLEQAFGRPSQPTWQPGETSEAQRQDQAISNILKADITPEQMPTCVDVYKALNVIWLHYDDVAIITTIPELVKRGKHLVERENLSYAEASVTCKRGSSTERPDPPSKRTGKAPESKESTPAGPKKSLSARQMGCPGGRGLCTVNQTTRWKNKGEFIKHFLAAHLGEYKVGDGFYCTYCEGTDDADTKYPFGSLLANHMWKKHMTIKKGSKRARSTAVEVKDKPEGLPGNQYGLPSGIESGDQLRRIAIREKVGDELGEPSGNPNGQTGDTEPSNFESREFFDPDTGNFDFIQALHGMDFDV